MVTYSMDRDSVEPVFYAVVPDSFMNRDAKGGTTRPRHGAGGSWRDETDVPVVAPSDPWSF